MRGRLAWTWNRLCAMSVAEMLRRTAFHARKQLWRRRTSWLLPAPTWRGADAWALPDLPEETRGEQDNIMDQAERILRGEYNLLNVSFVEPKLDWHLDPQTQVRAPTVFSFDIDYRDVRQAGNVKNIWEKNRHRHLTIAALAYGISKKQAYADFVRTQLASWIEQNPFLRGVNWASALEVGIRLLAWVWIERLLRGSSSSHGPLFGPQGILWPSIYQHQWLLSKYRSYGSSANNHLIGEMSALFTAASVWPYFPESARWTESARRILEREVLVQTFPSGLIREQAFSYQLFDVELFILAGAEAERIRQPFSSEFKARVRKMVDVIPSLVDVGGNLPRYGDGDEGLGIQLGPSRLESIYRIVRYWLGAQVPKPAAGGQGLLAATLLYLSEEPLPIQTQHSTQSFPDAGLYVLSSKRGTREEVFCLADAGPLGYLTLCAHGHADVLSLTLSVGGVPVLIDPGTYVYHADPQWRSYFRSTRAHNTLTIDGADQSIQAGTFLWTRKARVRLLKWEEGATPTLVAEHDGYARLRGGVIHRRSLELNERVLQVVDEVLGRREHEIEFRLHLTPECRVDLERGACRVRWEGGMMKIDLDPQMQWSLVPDWYSPGFNLKVATLTLLGRLKVALPVSLKTRLEVGVEN